MRKRQLAGRIVTYALLLLMISFASFPTIWMIVSSLKPSSDIYSTTPSFVPERVTLEHYRTVFSIGNFVTALKNSFMVGTTATVVAVVLGCAAAYGLARYPLRGIKYISVGVLFTQMLPRAVFLVPLYLMLDRIHLINTHTGLVLVLLTITLPFSTWMMKGYFSSVPAELEEAAMIDGCSPPGALLRVILPVAAPGVAATTTYAFISAWNEYMYPLVFINNRRLQTLPVELATFSGEILVDWGAIMAAAVVLSIPSLLLFTILNRYIVSGISLGSVKG